MEQHERISQNRKEYQLSNLSKSTVLANPFEQFKLWFDQAYDSKVLEPNAFAIATSGVDCQPSVRMVLLKKYDERGFVFFTNYESRKGYQLNENPKASMLFFWPTLERQIRIEGLIEKTSPQESDEYFESRPRIAQIGAAVSKQSEIVSGRKELEDSVKDFEKACEAKQVERPENWGGFRLKPEQYEFWQGRESRLHDRLFFTRINSVWELKRLWP